jgi:hypothetical protein
LNDKSELVLSDAPRTVKAFNYIVRVYYGLNPDTEKFDDVILSTISKINLKYPSLTFEQLNLSYSETTIEKKQGVSLSEGELIAPIASLHQKSVIIRKESERMEIEKRNLELKQQEENKFRAEAIDLYNQCLPNKKWTGTPFQSATFAECFKDDFTREEKDAIFERCRLIRRKLKNRADMNVFHLASLVSEKHLFFQKITHEAIKKGLKLKIELK